MAGNNTATVFEPVDRTLDNLGGGEGLAAANAADHDLQVKSLVAGAGVTLSSTGTEVTIASNLRVTDVSAVANITARDAITGQDEGDVAIVATGASGALETYIWDGTAWQEMGFGADVAASRTLTAGGGLTGGGDLTADRTFALDINGQTDLGAAPAAADEVIMWDASASAFVKVNFSDFTSGISSAANLGYTASPTNGIVTNTAGTDATLPLATTTNAGLMAPADKTKVDFVTVTQAVDLDAMEQDIADHQAALGIADGDQNMGTYTGTTITDNQTIKQNLQEVETALEAKKGVVTVTGSLGAAAVTVDVAHGLATAPALVDVQLTLTNKTLVQNLYVTAVDATNVTVTALRVPGSAQTFNLMIAD